MGRPCLLAVILVTVSGTLVTSDVSPLVSLSERLHDNGTLAVTCTVNVHPSEIRSIQIGANSTTIATLSDTITNNLRSDYGYLPKLGLQYFEVDLVGRLELDTSYLRVLLNVTGCHAARYFCNVDLGSGPDSDPRLSSNNADRQSVEKDVAVCDGALTLTLATPDLADPARFTLTCGVNSDMTSVGDVILMQIRRVRQSVTDRYGTVQEGGTEVVAQATASNKKVTGHALLASKGMTFSGSISQSDPTRSEIRIESGLCEHAGDYVCDLFYRQQRQRRRGGRRRGQAAATAGTRWSVAMVTVPDVCENPPEGLPAPTLSVDVYISTAIQAFPQTDLSAYSLHCTGRTGQSEERAQHEYHVQAVSVELSVVPDHSGGDRKPIASFSPINGDVLDPQPYLQPDYSQRGFKARGDPKKFEASVGLFGALVPHGPSLTVTTQAGVCSDAGVYRCSVVYWDLLTSSLRVAIAEQRMEPCGQGAVATHRAYRRTRHQHHTFSFTCSANATLVAKVISLEVSRVHNGSREVLAVATAYVDGGRASKRSDTPFTVSGQVDPLTPTTSRLTITTVVARGRLSPSSSLITTCRAVVVAADGGGVVEAISDGRLEYP